MEQKQLKNTSITRRLSTEKISEYFSLKYDNVIHQIDTFYYSISVVDSWDKQQPGIKNLLDYLENCNENAIVEEYVELKEFDFTDYKCIMKGFGFEFYRYDITVEDCFSAFVAKKVPNEKTPPIIVMLKSQFLWLYGVEYAVAESLKVIKGILDFCDIPIKELKINRIDFAYHNNLIQNPLKHFREDKLPVMQVSKFKRWHKEGTLTETDVECDYFTLGRRKSNNVFFRAYLKNQEIVSQQYKQFFLVLWVKKKLISEYDFAVLQDCFIHGNYNYLDKARIKFYLKFEKRKIISDLLNRILENDKIPLHRIKKLADKLTPPVTKVMNLEFQTKRKYLSSVKIEGDIEQKFYCAASREIEIFLKYKKYYHDNLTQRVLRFIDIDSKVKEKRKRPTSRWWSFIQNVKMKTKFHPNDIILTREYQKSLDIKAVRKSITSKLATLAVYRSKEKVKEGIMDYIVNLNENDIKFFDKKRKEKSDLLKGRINGLSEDIQDDEIILINGNTGEVLLN